MVLVRVGPDHRHHRLLSTLSTFKLDINNICTKRGQFGYVTVDWENPLKEWTFHAVSGAVTSQKFGHGLGVGDVNGDGRLDIIHKDGWFAQPPSDKEAVAVSCSGAPSMRWAKVRG